MQCSEFYYGERISTSYKNQIKEQCSFIFKGPVPREVFILNGWSAETDFAPTILSSHHLLSLIVHCYVYAKGI